MKFVYFESVSPNKFLSSCVASTAYRWNVRTCRVSSGFGGTGHPVMAEAIHCNSLVARCLVILATKSIKNMIHVGHVGSCRSCPTDYFELVKKTRRSKNFRYWGGTLGGTLPPLHLEEQMVNLHLEVLIFLKKFPKKVSRLSWLIRKSEIWTGRLGLWTLCSRADLQCPGTSLFAVRQLVLVGDFLLKFRLEQFFGCNNMLGHFCFLAFFFSVVQVKFSHHFAMIIQWNKNYHLMEEKTTQLDLRLERHKRKDACLLPQAILEANCISKNRQETNWWN